MWSAASKGAELKWQLKMLTIVIETKVRIRQIMISFHVFLKEPAKDSGTGQGGPVVRQAANVGPRQERYQRCSQQQVKLSQIIIKNVNLSDWNKG
jgi:hypothetical protein